MEKFCKVCNIEITPENRYARNLMCKKCHNKRRTNCDSYKNKRVGKKNILTEEQKERITNMINEGLKMSFISKELKIQYHIVNKFCKKL